MNGTPRSCGLAPMLVGLLVICFVLMGLAMIPHAGIQTDEAIFTSAMFTEPYPWFAISIFKKMVPLMVMSYLGTAKTALYTIIFTLWQPNVYSLRVPALLLGALSLVLTYLLFKRIAGRRAALFGTALLSFDTSYLLATVFDWGPVAIQHVCLLGGLLLLLKYGQEGEERALAGGFFLLGLGMWDKAIFAWMLSGAVVAAAIVFPFPLMRNLRPKQISKAAIFFSLGALPLIIYNVRKPLATFRGNASFSRENLPQKLRVLEVTARGSALFGFFGPTESERPREPEGALEAAFTAFSKATGNRQEHWLWHAWLASIALTPVLLFTKWRKAIAFTVIMMLVAWLQMVFTRDTGGATHHVILLWPFPILMIALAGEWLAEKAGRFGNAGMAAVALILSGSCLMVTSTYVSHFVRHGSAGPWSDAVFDLAEVLSRRNGQTVYLTDWGMLDNTRMLTQGKVPLRWASDPLTAPQLTADHTRFLNEILALPNAVFVLNTDDRQIFPEVNAKLARLTGELGFEREPVTTIRDSHGRVCFEIVRFRRKTIEPSIGVVKGRVGERVPASGGVGRVVEKEPVLK
ncbi:MAG: glycosyltransferase family 39 protein [Bryobacteraceae bacterium]|nr:glycosyltransferase family 39 protein [Bryobacteraceae bacterium]